MKSTEARTSGAGAVSSTRAYPSEDETDPNGHPVRIGGGPGLINPPNNGMTYNGTIPFKDRPSYENDLTKPHWQDHEEAHIVEAMNFVEFPRLGLQYAFAALLEWGMGLPPSQGGPTGHDLVPSEVWADEYADDKESIGRW